MLRPRYDDVREVFATDPAFGVTYKDKLDVIMGGEPFFLGMAQHPAISGGYRRDAQGDEARGPRPGWPPTWRRGPRRSSRGAGGRVEVVDTLVRRVTFEFLADYLGVPEPPGGDLRVLGDAAVRISVRRQRRAACRTGQRHRARRSARISRSRSSSGAISRAPTMCSVAA